MYSSDLRRACNSLNQKGNAHQHHVLCHSDPYNPSDPGEPGAYGAPVSLREQASEALHTYVATLPLLVPASPSALHRSHAHRVKLFDGPSQFQVRCLSPYREQIHHRSALSEAKSDDE